MLLNFSILVGVPVNWHCLLRLCKNIMSELFYKTVVMEKIKPTSLYFETFTSNYKQNIKNGFTVVLQVKKNKLPTVKL